jgi:hypothetical protein
MKETVVEISRIGAHAVFPFPAGHPNEHEHHRLETKTFDGQCRVAGWIVGRKETYCVRLRNINR